MADEKNMRDPDQNLETAGEIIDYPATDKPGTLSLEDQMEMMQQPLWKQI